MKFVPLTFKKIGNHWYLDIEHDNPQDLMLDPILERFIGKLDKFGEGIVSKIYLSEQGDIIFPEGSIQFTDSDLLRYFTTNDDFDMTIYINNHKFKISSNLYTLLETKYQFDFHISSYRFIVDEV